MKNLSTEDILSVGNYMVSSLIHLWGNIFKSDIQREMNFIVNGLRHLFSHKISPE